MDVSSSHTHSGKETQRSVPIAWSVPSRTRESKRMSDSVALRDRTYLFVDLYARGIESDIWKLAAVIAEAARKQAYAATTKRLHKEQANKQTNRQIENIRKQQHLKKNRIEQHNPYFMLHHHNLSDNTTKHLNPHDLSYTTINFRKISYVIMRYHDTLQEIHGYQ